MGSIERIVEEGFFIFCTLPNRKGEPCPYQKEDIPRHVAPRGVLTGSFPFPT
jgi:hypothetical protein